VRFETSAYQLQTYVSKILIFDGYLRLSTCATRRACKRLCEYKYFLMQKKIEEKNKWKSGSEGARISRKSRCIVRRNKSEKTRFYARLSSKQRNCRQWLMHPCFTLVCRCKRVLSCAWILEQVTCWSMRCVILVLPAIPPRVSFKLIIIDDAKNRERFVLFTCNIFNILIIKISHSRKEWK